MAGPGAYMLSTFELSKKGGRHHSLVVPGGGARSGTSIEWNPARNRMEGLHDQIIPNL